MVVSEIVAFCKRASKYANHLVNYMQEYEINSLLRARHFLSQLAHETAGFVYVREIASGADYDTGRKAAMLGNTPEADGDGQKYKGRGLIQVTGRANYEACSLALFGDKRLLDTPELLEQPEWAVKSACWFWQTKKLNALADANDIERITKRINGGLNGFESRKKWYARAEEIIKTE